MSHLRDAYGRNSSNSARSMSNMLGVWIQISGFCRDSTKTTIPKILFPLNAKICRNSASVCPSNRATREVLPFSNSGRFFHKRRYFFRDGLFFFQAAFPAPCSCDTPCGAGVYFFFLRRVGKRFPRGTGRQGVRTRGGRIFFEGNTHTTTIPARQSPPFAKKFRATERIGYQGATIFAQPPRPPAGRARAAAERARRRATRSQATISAEPVGVARPSARLLSVVSARRLSIAPCPYARPASPYVPRPPIRPKRPCNRPSHRVRPTVRARHLPNTQMFSAHNMLIINKHKRNIHLKTAKYIHFAAENPQPLPSFLPRPSHPSTGRKTMIIAERS